MKIKCLLVSIIFILWNPLQTSYAQNMYKTCDIERSSFVDMMRKKLNEICGSDTGEGWGDNRYLVVQDIFAYEQRNNPSCIDANKDEIKRLNGVINYYKRGEMPKDYMDMEHFTRQNSTACRKFLMEKFGESNTFEPKNNIQQEGDDAAKNYNHKSNPQQISQNSLNASQKNNVDAETYAARVGKRKHNPRAEAHQCLRPDVGGLYGGFTNSCPYQVDYEFCTTGAKSGAWASMMDCSVDRIGAGSVGANRQTTDLLNGAQMVYWFACKYPYKAVGASFDPTKGITSRCVEWPR